jgi:transposase
MIAEGYGFEFIYRLPYRYRFRAAQRAAREAGRGRRHIIERAVGWLKRLGRLATRAEKLATPFAAMITIALVARYATRYLSDTT